MMGLGTRRNRPLDPLAAPPTREMLDAGLEAALRPMSDVVRRPIVERYHDGGDDGDGSDGGDSDSDSESSEGIQLETIHLNDLLTEEVGERDLAPEPAVVENTVENTSIDEFINNFRTTASEFLGAAYRMRRPIDRSHIYGTLSTSLAEDVFALADSQCGLLHEYLASNGLLRTQVGDSLLAEALLSMLINLRVTQSQFRDSFLVDLPSSVAAANDFCRMAERVEQLLRSVEDRYAHLEWPSPGGNGDGDGDDDEDDDDDDDD